MERRWFSASSSNVRLRFPIPANDSSTGAGAFDIGENTELRRAGAVEDMIGGGEVSSEVWVGGTAEYEALETTTDSRGTCVEDRADDDVREFTVSDFAGPPLLEVTEADLCGLNVALRNVLELTLFTPALGCDWDSGGISLARGADEVASLGCELDDVVGWVSRTFSFSMSICISNLR